MDVFHLVGGTGSKRNTCWSLGLDGGDGAGAAPRSLQVPRGHKAFWSTNL